MDKAKLIEGRRRRNCFRSLLSEIKETFSLSGIEGKLNEILELITECADNIGLIEAAFTIKPFPILFDIIKNCDVQHQFRVEFSTEKYISEEDDEKTQYPDKKLSLKQACDQFEKEKSNREQSKLLECKTVRGLALKIFQICSKSVHFNYDQDFSDVVHVTFFMDFMFNNSLTNDEINDIFLILIQIVKTSRNSPHQFFKEHILKKLSNIEGNSSYFGELLYLVFTKSKLFINSNTKECYLNIANSILVSDDQNVEQMKYALYTIYEIIAMGYTFNINTTIDYVNAIFRGEQNESTKILLPTAIRIIGKTCSELPYFTFIAGFLTNSESSDPSIQTEIIQSSLSALLDGLESWNQEEELKTTITTALVTIFETQPLSVKLTGMKLLQYTITDEQYTEDLLDIFINFLSDNDLKNDAFEHLIHMYGILEDYDIGSLTMDDLITKLYDVEYLIEEEASSNEKDEIREFCTNLLDTFASAEADE